MLIHYLKSGRNYIQSIMLNVERFPGSRSYLLTTGIGVSSDYPVKLV